MNVVFFFSNHGHSSASNTPAALCQQPWPVLQPESPVAVSQDRQLTARGRTRTERDKAKTHTNTDKVGNREQEVKILDIYHDVFYSTKRCSFCQFLYFVQVQTAVTSLIIEFFVDIAKLVINIFN